MLVHGPSDEAARTPNCRTSPHGADIGGWRSTQPSECGSEDPGPRLLPSSQSLPLHACKQPPGPMGPTACSAFHGGRMNQDSLSANWIIRLRLPINLSSGFGTTADLFTAFFICLPLRLQAF